MNKYIWLPVVLVLIMIVTIVFQRPGSAGNTRNIANNLKIESNHQKQEKESSEALPSSAVGRAIVDEETYDFGTMNPDTEAEHTFIVRNEGDAPLQIRRGSTTCKCTMSKISRHTVPPGEEESVHISWHTGKDKSSFNQTATILTNDPNKSAITFRVKGLVRQLVALDPPEIVFPGLDSGKTQSTEVLVYSQAWQDFSVSKMDLSNPGWTCRLEPADPESLAKHDATSGYKLLLTTPDNLKTGNFSHWLRLHLIPENNEANQRVEELILAGEVLAPMSIHSKKIKGGKVLELGIINEGESVSENLMLVVRDEQRNLSVKEIKCIPDYLNVSLRSLKKNDAAGKSGIYQIVVRVPPDAPSSDYMGVNHGEIEILTDHPRIKRLNFQVELAVIKRLD